MSETKSPVVIQHKSESIPHSVDRMELYRSYRVMEIEKEDSGTDYKWYGAVSYGDIVVLIPVNKTEGYRASRVFNATKGILLDPESVGYNRGYGIKVVRDYTVGLVYLVVDNDPRPTGV